jgi:hypothetical protein
VGRIAEKLKVVPGADGRAFQRKLCRDGTKFPKATFAGQITNLSEVNLAKDGTYNAVVTGKMTLHGVTKDITANGALNVSGREIRVNAGFSLMLRDYGINIPSLVSDKVTKDARILNWRYPRTDEIKGSATLKYQHYDKEVCAPVTPVSRFLQPRIRISLHCWREDRGICHSQLQNEPGHQWPFQ